MAVVKGIPETALWASFPEANRNDVLGLLSMLLERLAVRPGGRRKGAAMSTVLPRERGDGKIQGWHHDRLAVVYVRQSSRQQVADHGESTRLQYGLTERAVALGWPASRVMVIDEDLGRSAANAAGRPGFARLVAEITMGHVGLVLGLEMSRLARAGRDWHQLIELCSLAGALLADADGVYDPNWYNDRLLLGLKGTMTELELHLIRQRMASGRLAKAGRGELAVPLPAGYVLRPSGEAAFDPDEQVQAVIRLVFRLFEQLGTVHAVLRFLVEHQVQIGMRERSGPGKGEVTWRAPHQQGLANMLRNPAYAGIYAYGRSRTDPSRRLPGHEHSGRVRRPEAGEWLVRIDGALPAYISAGQYERNQARLAANRARAESPGAPREGPALLGGLVACGICGHRLQVSYETSRQGLTGRYCCQRRHHTYGEARCQQMAAGFLDDHVVAQVLSALAPAALELSVTAAGQAEARRASRPDLAAAPGTRGLRLRPGAAPVPAGRAREPPGGPPARARVGRGAGRTGAPGRGVRAVPAAAPGTAVARRTGGDPRPGRGHPGPVGRADDHRRRPQEAAARGHRVRPGHRGGCHRTRACHRDLGRRPSDPRRPAPPGGPDRPAVVLPGAGRADQGPGRRGPGQRRNRRPARR